MAGNTTRKFKWFWAWQDEQEEAWLRSMSQKGWHLSSLGLPGIYSFRAGEPQDFVYRLDYQKNKKKDQQDYLQLFNDAGWEHLGQISNWQYFRKESQTGEAPEIFTDVESKVAKYKKLLSYSAFFFVIFMTLFLIALFSKGTLVVSLLAMVGLLYAIIRLMLRIRQLRNPKYYG